MDPLTIATLGGVGSTLLGGYLGNKGQEQANEQNYDIAQEQMGFQQMMSDTAYQRSKQDMLAAGLNPLMMYGSGGPASTPGGATANMQNAQAPGASALGQTGGLISKGMDTAVAMRGQKNLQAVQEAQIDQMGAQNDNIEADTANKFAQQALIQNQQANTAKDIESKTMANQMMKETLPAQIKKANAEGNYSEINQIMGIINSGASSASSLINPLNFLKGIKMPPPSSKPGYEVPPNQ